MRSRIGMLFKNGALFDNLAVWENIVFGLRPSALPARLAQTFKHVLVVLRPVKCWPATGIPFEQLR